MSFEIARSVKRPEGLPNPLTASKAFEHPVASAYQKKIHSDLVANPELLKQSSLVDTLKHDELAALLKNNPKLFSHICLGSKISGSAEYEGIDALPVLQWSSALLTLLHKGEHSDTLFKVEKTEELLKQSSELLSFSEKVSAIRNLKGQNQQKKLANDLINFIFESVRDLQIGQSFLMEGGTAYDQHTHGMYYSFTKENNDTYTIKIYNSSNDTLIQDVIGNEQHDRQVQSPIIFAGVTFKDLFFTEDRNKIQLGFFQTLVELLVFPSIYTNDWDFHFSMDDVFSAFMRFQHKFVPSSKQSRLFSTLARASTHKQKALNGLFLDHCGNTKIYKSYSFNSRVLALVNMFHAWECKGLQEPDSSIRTQLRLSAMNIAQKLLKYPNESHERYPEFTKDQILKLYATCIDILQRVEIAEAKANDEMRQYNVQILNQDLDKASKAYVSFRTAEIARERKRFREDDDAIISYTWPDRITPEKFSNDFEKFTNYCKSLLLANKSERFKKEVEKFFEILPVPIKFPDDQFWGKVDFNLNVFSQLRDLFSSYCAEVGKIEPSGLPEEHNTLMTVMAIMHQMCWTIDKNSGKNYLRDLSIGCSYFEKLYIEDCYLLIKEPKILERRQQLVDYFKRVKKAGIFEYKDKETKYFLRSPEHLLYQKILDANPEAYRDYIEILKKDELYGRIFKSKMNDPEIAALFVLNDHTGNIYCLANNPHILYARQMCVDAQICLGVNYTYSSGNSKYVQFNEHWINLYSSIQREGYLKFLEGGQQYAPVTLLHKQERNRKYLDRTFDKTKHLSQGWHLLNNNTQENETDRRCEELLGVLSDPESSVHTLIYRLRQHLDWVEHKDVKDLIQYLLYKPYCEFEQGPRLISLFQQLRLNPEELLNQFRKFFDESMRALLYNKDEKLVDISSVLYLVRLAHQVERAFFQIHGTLTPSLYPDKVFTDLEKIILSCQDISYSDLFSVFLHKIDKITLSPPETWTTDMWKEVYANWMIIHSVSGVEMCPASNRTFIIEIRKKMIELEPYISKLIEGKPDFADELMNHIIDELGIGVQPGSIMLKKVLNSAGADVTATISGNSIPSNNSKPFSFRRKSAENKIMVSMLSSPKSWNRLEGELIFTKVLHNDTEMTLNLSTGEVLSGDQVLCGKRLDFSNNGNFNRIFGNRRLKFGYGGDVYFDDIFYGRCRIINDDLENGIQRLIKGRWHTYIPPHKTPPGLPKILKGGFCHWLYLDRQMQELSFIISDAATGKDVYEIDEDEFDDKGAIHPFGRPKENLLQLDSKWNISFEKPECVMVWKNDEKLNLEFFRYKSKPNKCLSFTQSDSKSQWICDHDPDYCLAVETGSAPLGFYSHYLLLQHVNDPKIQKILVPLHRVASNRFSSAANLDIPVADENNQAQIYEYLEYNLENGEIVGNYSVEHWLLLTQIYAAQKNYLKALDCLNHITRSDEISLRSHNIFQMFLAGSTGDTSPEASALKLRAFCKLMLAKGSGIRSLGIIGMYNNYLQGKNSVSAPLRLSSKLEKKLIEYLKSGAFQRREAFLNTGDTFTEELSVLSIDPYPDLKVMPIAYEYESTSGKEEEALLENLKRHKKEKDRYYSFDFFESYQILKNGTDEERENHLYRIQRVISCDSLTRYCSNIIHLVYKFPHLVPDLPQDRSQSALLAWVKDLHKVYTERGIHLTEKEKKPVFNNYSLGPFVHKKIKNNQNKPQKDIDENSVLIPPLSTSQVNESLEESLESIRKQALIKNEVEVQNVAAVELNFDVAELSQNEKSLKEIIESEFAEFNKDLKEGKKRQVTDAPYAFRNGQETQVQPALEQLLKSGVLRCDQLKEAILKEVRRLPVDPKKQLELGLSRIGYSVPDISIMDLAKAAGTGKLDRYKVLLPHMTEQEIHSLHTQVVEYLVEQTTVDQVQFILSVLKRLENTTSVKEKESLRIEAATALSKVRSYKPHENLAALYFEYASKIRLREAQSKRFHEIVEAIFDAKKGILDKGLVFQMIQGAGKSAVVLSRLMELVSERGYVSLLVCHHSQIEAAKGSMKKYQRERFGKEIIPINYTSEELEDVDILREIKSKLIDSENEKESVIISSGNVQSLQLLLLQYLLQRAHIDPEDPLEASLDNKIELLLAINRHIMEKGVGLLDEVDLILDILQRVNFPIGERIHLEKQRIDLVHQIFEVLSSDECEQYLQLSKNKQQNYSENDYWEKIVPMIAKALPEHNTEMLIEERYKASYKRYLLNEIDKDVELAARGELAFEKLGKLTLEKREDYEFMRYLHINLKGSAESFKNEAANLIALSRGIVRKILPLTLRKSFNRDYGFDENDPQHLIPYLGVDAPSDTEFGNVYEHLCFSYQAAVNASFSEKAVEKYVLRLQKIAKVHVQLGEKFEETDEARQYFTMTGLRLSDPITKENLKIATRAINKDSKSKLLFQNELANFFLTYHSMYLSSTPLALVDQFKTTVGCAATISNAHSYNSKMEQVLPEHGAEGKVIATLLERTKNGQKPVTVIESQSLPEILQECFADVPLERVQSLIDGGGLLKQFSAYEVAKEVLTFFKKKQGERIKGVFFYYRPSTANEKQPQEKNGKIAKEGFALLKEDENGELEFIQLEDTTRKTIEAHGLKIENIFFSLDELRSIGTDVTMPSDALAVGTVSGESLSIISQMIMRLRDYFIGQDIQFAAAASTKETLLGNRLDHAAPIQTGLKNQALKKSDETFRSLKEQSHNGIRTSLIKELLKNKSIEEATEFTKKFESFFVTTITDKPYESFAFIEREASAKEILEEIGKAQITQFTAASKDVDADTETIKTAALEMNKKLLIRAEKLPELRRKFVKDSSQELGLHFRQTEKVAVQAKLRTNVQMKQEEQSYNKEMHYDVYTEAEWQVLPKWSLYNLGVDILSVSEALNDVDRTDGWISIPGLYRQDYSSCFPENIKMTENFRYTANVPLPVFHKAQKFAEYVLIFKNSDNKVECIMLSQRDANFWISRGKTLPGMWLMNPEGDLLLPGSDPLPDPDDIAFWDESETALWYVNFFNGNVAALEKRQLLTQAILDTSDNLMQKFLYLRTSHQTQQRQLLDINPLFSINRNIQGEFMLCKARFSRELEQRRAVAKKSQRELEDLSPDLVSFVPTDRVKELSKLEQIRRLHRGQVNHINPKYANYLSANQVIHLKEKEIIQALNEPSLIKVIPIEQASHLATEQIKHHIISVKLLTDILAIQAIKEPHLIQFLDSKQIIHLLPDQVQHVKLAQVPFLKSSEQIRALKTKKQINAIDPSMLLYLMDEQIAELRNKKLIQLLPPEKVKLVHNEAVPMLDETQLPFLKPKHYPYISKKQYDYIKSLENIPDNLKPIWSRIGPCALECLSSIIEYAGKNVLPAYPGTRWHYILTLIDTLTDDDYEGIDQRNAAHGIYFRSINELLPPQELFRCKNVEVLSLDGCLPSLFTKDNLFSKHFKKLKNLNIYDTPIQEFPADIQNLTQLRVLRIQNTKISFLPSWIGDLTSLVDLSIVKSKLEKIPDEICKLTKMKNLRFQINQLTSLPKDLGNLTALEILRFEDNRLTEIPESLTQLSKLQQLNLHDNRLQKLPSGFGKCADLDELSLQNNNLKTLPNDLIEIKKLNAFDFYSNPFEELPKVAYQFCGHTLTSNFQNCNIRHLSPEYIVLMSKSCYVELAANPLEELPEEIGTLTQIKELNLQGTKIKALPKSLSKLENLSTLNLSYTQMTELPEFLLNMPNLKIINLAGCFIAPDSSIVQKLLKAGVHVRYEKTEPSALNGIPAWKFEGKSDPNEKPVVVPEKLQDFIAGDRVYELMQLLNQGFDPNTLVEFEGRQLPILQWALTRKHDKLAEKIINKGCKIDSLEFTDSPVSLICHRENPNAELIRLLMEKLNQKEISLEDTQELFVKISTSKSFIQQHELYELIKSRVTELHINSISKFLMRHKRLYWIGEALHRAVLYMNFKRAIKKSPKKVTLDKLGYALYLFDGQFSKTRQTVAEGLNKLAQGKLSIEEVENSTHVPSMELLIWAQEKGPHEAVSQLMISDMKLNQNLYKQKVFTNLFLDKTLVMNKTSEAIKVYQYTNPESLYGMRVHIAGMAVAKGLKGVIDNPKSSISTELKERFKNELYNPMIQACYWEKLMFTPEGREKVTNDLMHSLANLGINERVLVPAGNKSHNVLIQVKRTSEKEFAIKVIDTLSKGEKFQSFLAYTNIPRKSVLQKEEWGKIIGAVWEEHSDLKIIIGMKLAAEGKMVQPSKDPVDYSSGQLQNTCPATPWWHWLRHEVTEMVTKTDDRWTAYVEWRILKNQIRQNILIDFNYTKTENSVDERVTKACTEKINKHGQLMHLLEIARNKEEFNRTLQHLRKLIVDNQIMSEEEIEEMLGSSNRNFDSFKNPGARWRLLHTVSNRIAQEAQANKKFRHNLFQNKDKHYLQYIFLSLADFEYSKKCLRTLLRDLEKDDRWYLIGHILGELVRSPKLWMFAVSESKKWMEKGPKAKVAGSIKADTIVQQEFLEVVNKGKNKGRVVFELAKHFRKNKIMAQSFWAQYRTFMKDQLIQQLENDEISVDDVPLVADGVDDIKDIIQFLVAFRRYAFDKKVIDVITAMINKVLKIEEDAYSKLSTRDQLKAEKYPHLKTLAEYLYKYGFDQYAQYITDKVLGKA